MACEGCARRRAKLGALIRRLHIRKKAKPVPKEKFKIPLCTCDIDRTRCIVHPEGD